MTRAQTAHYEIVQTIDGTWMILVQGFQWGVGPYDRSGCSSQTWPTYTDAYQAAQEAHL